MSNRKLGRLFVRQRFTPPFDVPIKIENTDEPLGNARVYSIGDEERRCFASLERYLDAGDIL
jgi:hypothetical protein